MTLPAEVLYKNIIIPVWPAGTGIFGGAAVDVKQQPPYMRNLWVPNHYGLWVQVGGSNPHIQIVIEASWDDTDANFTQIEGAVPLLQVLGAGTHVINFPEIDMSFSRLRVTALSGNPSDTTLVAYIYVPKPVTDY